MNNTDITIIDTNAMSNGVCDDSDNNSSDNHKPIFISTTEVDRASFAGMLLYILLRRMGNNASVTLDEAAQLPKGWRDQVLVAETKDGAIHYRLQ